MAENLEAVKQSYDQMALEILQSTRRTVSIISIHTTIDVCNIITLVIIFNWCENIYYS